MEKTKIVDLQSFLQFLAIFITVVIFLFSLSNRISSMEASRTSDKELLDRVIRNQEGVITILNAHLLENSGEKVKLENLASRIEELALKNTEKLRIISKVK